MDTAAKAESSQRVYPILGIGGVLLGASIATFFGRLLSVGAADIRGALHLDVDSASWIGTTYNMSMMFIGPFSVYLGGILGARRVLLASAVLLTMLTAIMPFAGSFGAFLFLLLYFFFGRRKTREAFGNLCQHFWPDTVVAGDFLLQV